MTTADSSIEMYADATPVVDADALPEAFNLDPITPFMELASKRLPGQGDHTAACLLG